jgi:hypothetical protein
MTRRIITIAGVLFTLSTAPAAAQQFAGACRDYKEAAACTAHAAWCTWRSESGKRKASCAFKRGMKAKWQTETVSK